MSISETKKLLSRATTSVSSLAIIITISSLLLFVVTISVISPDQAGPVTITAMLALLYAFLGSVVFLTRSFFNKNNTTRLHKKQLLKKSYITAVPLIFVVGLNTLKQLSIQDVAIVVVLFLIANFYISKTYGI